MGFYSIRINNLFYTYVTQKIDLSPGTGFALKGKPPERKTQYMRSKPNKRVKVMSALLTTQPGKQGEFLQTLQSLRAEIRQQLGCLECTIGQDTEEDSRFVIFMVWKDLAHLEAHMDSEAFRVLLGATSVLTTPTGFRFIATDMTADPPVDSILVRPGSIGRRASGL